MKVGIVGLGIMGSAYARNLVKAGVSVEGADPSEAAREKAAGLGAVAHEKVGPWLADCDFVILSLISPGVLIEVAGELAQVLKPGQIVLDTGTFALADKLAAKEALEPAGAVLLDCTVSGTGAQAWEADLVFMASGPADAVRGATPMLERISKSVIHAGEFGAGIAMKFVANHAVALHNAAAAETLHYAEALGLDLQLVYRMLSGGAGQSKMSDLRLPLMIEQRYEPPTASLKMFEKDLRVIGEDLAAHGLDLPIFDAVRALYKEADRTLPESYDTAAVYEVYRASGS
ncbi:NAD(P)-dependent oxidoreductase [Histidinibacterium lentulum]|nr:NAD(P)-dependent oxidoreductase [Histidinibacterium lentulum]